jgi:hypothetical protein
MNCPEVQELFSDYLDGRLAASQATLLKEHLRFCSACRRELEVLRSTVALIGSLNEIKTSPDFLIQVNNKIDSGWKLGRLWRWAFVPAKIKLPVEAAALATVAILAVYLYRSSELSQLGLIFSQKGPERSVKERRKAELDPGGPTQDRNTVLAHKELRSKEALPLFSEALSGKEAPASPPEARVQRALPPPSTEPSDLAGSIAKKEEFLGGSPAGVEREALPAAPRAAAPGRADRIAKAPEQILEVKSEDLELFQRRIRDMLANVTGRVVSEQVSEEGLLLAVELPESREEEFRSALKKETGRGLSRTAAKKGQSAKAEEEQRARSPVPAAQRTMSREEKSTAAKEEPTVAIQIRVWAKK